MICILKKTASIVFTTWLTLHLGWSQVDTNLSQYSKKPRQSEANFSTDLFLFQSTAFQLKKGEGRYKNVLLGFNTLNYGVTNRLSVGAGTEILSLALFFSNEGFRPRNLPISFNIKYGFSIAPQLKLAFGAKYLGLFFSREVLTYGVMSYGNAQHNLSIGGGTLFRFNNPQGSLLTIGGNTRIYKSFGLLTETWVRNKQVYSINGFRIHDKKSTFDLGLLYNNTSQIRESSQSIWIPIAGINILF